MHLVKNLGNKVLWSVISNKMESFTDKNVCLCGDFNAVCCVEERRSVGYALRHAGSAAFNGLIDNNYLVDLPLWGRSYTWFRGYRRSMSRINRFLLSGRCCLTWTNCFQTATSRGLSDHCPLELSVDEEFWSTRPFCMLKCWENFTGYNNFVREKWDSFRVEGWGGYVLKEKFKLIKLTLKEWHQQHPQNLPVKILTLKERISAIDLKGELELLLEEEVEELHELSENLFSLSRMNSSIRWQQSRM